MADVVVFRPDPHAGSSFAHATSTVLDTGHGLYVRGHSRLDKVELSRCSTSDYLSFKVTAAEARAIAAELLAAATAADLAKEVSHG